MMIKMFGSAIYGIDAVTITIEVNWTPSGKMYHIVGLPDNAIRESFQRIESSIKCLGYHMPRTKIVVNLAPADIRKSGTAFDLPIALGILAASGQLEYNDALSKYVIMGELGLDGSLRSIRGALPIAMQTVKEKFKGLILPQMNAMEAAIVHGLPVYGVNTLNEIIEFFHTGQSSIQPTIYNKTDLFSQKIGTYEADFMDVKGQENIKRALEIAAAGGHNAILIGPPGAGKTMLAKRLPTIMPPMTLQESLETTRIHSVAGKLTDNSPLILNRPFRNPHHTVSYTALAGGGNLPQPGEISLAHHGILFLDELPEYSRMAIEVMRQPMEDRKINISRSKYSVEFPASFQLIASMNPCPCGYFNHPSQECTCPPGMVQKYLSRISGPVMDRIDMHIEVTPLPIEEITNQDAGESSKQIRDRVVLARMAQTKRLISHQIHCNAQMPGSLAKKIVSMNDVSSRLLKNAMEKMRLSARAYERILKLARTIADLALEETVMPEHIAEAIQYRSLDRSSWRS